MRFSVEFEKVFIFQGFEGILNRKVVIFDEVKSGEMLDFCEFARSQYRSILGVLFENWIFEVDV